MGKPKPNRFFIGVIMSFILTLVVSFLIGYLLGMVVRRPLNKYIRERRKP